MTTIYSYGGKPYHRSGNDLYSPSGQHVGRFHGDRVFNTSGSYIGEIKSGKLARSTMYVGISGPSVQMASRAVSPSVQHAASALPAGFVDFTA